MFRKQFLKCGALMILFLLISVAVGTSLLTAVYTIPEKRIEENVIESTELLYEEGNYPQVFKWCTSKLDNFTDTLMLKIAAHQREDSAFTNAMLAARGVVKGISYPTKNIYAHYIKGVPYDYEKSYIRYWHGYLIFLKPILTVLNYMQIRVLNLVLQLILSAIALYLLKIKNMKEYMIPFTLMIAFLFPFITARSMQYSTCFYIIMAISIVMILIKDKIDKKAVYIFLFSGILTSFFDFLTYPLATFGIPAVLYFVMQQSSNIKDNINKLVKIMLSWGFGFGGMWAGKWIVASTLWGNYVFKDAMNAATTRNGYQRYSEKGSVILEMILALGKNVIRFLNTPVTILALIFIVYCFVVIRKHNKTNKTDLKSVLIFTFPYIFIAILPFLWYVILLNHSTIHSIFTNKTLIVTAFAVMCSIVKYRNEANKKLI